VNENNDEIIVEIEDSRKGIFNKDLLHIFNPLFTTKKQDTGLVHVKSIVHAHGGIIFVTSRSRIFRITLPKN